LLTDQDEISNLYRGPSIDASYRVSVHLAKRFQRRRFFKIGPIRNKNCLWRPCLLMDRDKMSNLYRGPSIDASYQVSVHIAEGFQRRRLKCEKLKEDGRRTPSDGKSSHCLWQGELKIEWIFTTICFNQEKACNICPFQRFQYFTKASIVFCTKDKFKFGAKLISDNFCVRSGVLIFQILIFLFIKAFLRL
jgi:hypothetical protein